MQYKEENCFHLIYTKAMDKKIINLLSRHKVGNKKNRIGGKGGGGAWKRREREEKVVEERRGEGRDEGERKRGRGCKERGEKKRKRL